MKMRFGRNEIKGLFVLLAVIIASIYGINYASRKISEDESTNDSAGNVSVAENELPVQTTGTIEELPREETPEDDPLSEDDSLAIEDDSQLVEENNDLDNSQSTENPDDKSEEVGGEDEETDEQPGNVAVVTLPNIAEVIEESDSFVRMAIGTESASLLRVPERDDITLEGELEGLTVSDIRQDRDRLSLALSGSLNPLMGNGAILIEGDAVDTPIKIIAPVTNRPVVSAHSQLITQNSDTQTIRIEVSNDSFSDAIQPDMITMFGSISASKASDVRSLSDQAIEITLKGTFHTPASGDIIFAKEAFKSNSFSMKVFVQSVTPEISASLAQAVSEGTNEYVFTVTMPNNREDFINQLSFYLGGGFENFNISNVVWIDYRNVTVTIRGLLQNESEAVTQDGREVFARGDIYVTGLYDARCEVLIVK